MLPGSVIFQRSMRPRLKPSARKAKAMRPGFGVSEDIYKNKASPVAETSSRVSIAQGDADEKYWGFL